MIPHLPVIRTTILVRKSYEMKSPSAPARRHVALAPQDRDEEAIVVFAARHIRRPTKTKLFAARSGEERATAQLDQAEGRAP